MCIFYTCEKVHNPGPGVFSVLSDELEFSVRKFGSFARSCNYFRAPYPNNFFSGLPFQKSHTSKSRAAGDFFFRPLNFENFRTPFSKKVILVNRAPQAKKFFHIPKFRQFLGLHFQKTHTSKSRAAGENFFHTPKFREFPAPQNSY